LKRINEVKKKEYAPFSVIASPLQENAVIEYEETCRPKQEQNNKWNKKNCSMIEVPIVIADDFTDVQIIPQIGGCSSQISLT